MSCWPYQTPCSPGRRFSPSCRKPPELANKIILIHLNPPSFTIDLIAMPLIEKCQLTIAGHRHQGQWRRWTARPASAFWHSATQSGTAGDAKRYILQIYTEGLGVERDTSCTSTQLAVEMDTPCVYRTGSGKDTPCTSILLVVQRDTPCKCILYCRGWKEIHPAHPHSLWCKEIHPANLYCWLGWSRKWLFLLTLNS
jgi:hypothetical protein